MPCPELDRKFTVNRTDILKPKLHVTNHQCNAMKIKHLNQEKIYVCLTNHINTIFITLDPSNGVTHCPDLNRGSSDYETNALTTKLQCLELSCKFNEVKKWFENENLFVFTTAYKHCVNKHLILVIFQYPAPTLVGNSVLTELTLSNLNFISRTISLMI